MCTFTNIGSCIFSQYLLFELPNIIGQDSYSFFFFFVQSAVYYSIPHFDTSYHKLRTDL